MGQHYLHGSGRGGVALRCTSGDGKAPRQVVNDLFLQGGQQGVFGSKAIEFEWLAYLFVYFGAFQDQGGCVHLSG